jgi:hypothetical protein
MVKARNNELMLKQLELKLEIAKQKVIALETEMNSIKCDILDPPVKCCGKTFNSNIQLRFHTNTKSCLNKAKPYNKCKICRNTFYGLTEYEAKTLGKGNSKFDLSAYGQHITACHSCSRCGYLYKSYKDKSLNDCCSLQVEVQVEQPKAEHTHTQRPLSADSNISTSSELNDWEFDHKIYGVDNKNRVYDNYDNCIGKRIKDDFSDEYKIDYC